MRAETCVERPQQLVDSVNRAYEALFGVRFACLPVRADRVREQRLLDMANRRLLTLIVDTHAVLKRQTDAAYDVDGVADHQTNSAYVRKGIPFWNAIGTAGHEIGHLILPYADEEADEEAKAYAFQAAWVKTLFQAGVPGADRALYACRNPQGADDDAHDRASRYVAQLDRSGADMLLIAREFAVGELRVPRNY